MARRARQGATTRGGFVVDIAWNTGTLMQAVVHATRSGVACVRNGGQVRDYRMRAGERVELRP